METKMINNEIYNSLGERWYTAFDDPVALLRQESKVKIPWISARISEHFSAYEGKIKILDLGCGAGFLSNHFAQASNGKFEIWGLDASQESLSIARKYDPTCSVNYQFGDAANLPFTNQFFDVVVALDFLEHVENPTEIITEVSRVLKPNGQFFFHTFNRNFLSHMVIIKLVELLVKNTPKNMHVIDLFITPEELTEYCKKNNLSVKEMSGIRPKFSTINMFDVFRRTVPRNFSFKLTKSLKLSYLGVAVKNE